MASRSEGRAQPGSNERSQAEAAGLALVADGKDASQKLKAGFPGAISYYTANPSTSSGQAFAQSETRALPQGLAASDGAEDHIVRRHLVRGNVG